MEYLIDLISGDFGAFAMVTSMAIGLVSLLICIPLAIIYRIKEEHRCYKKYFYIFLAPLIFISISIILFILRLYLLV